MKFTLTYRGGLSANGGPDEKHKLRCHFHKQLLKLWNLPPLRDKPHDAIGSVIAADGGRKTVGRFNFVPLVGQSRFMTADLRIVFLRPSAPGGLVGAGGDIDNRIKTLLDAFSIPPCNQLPSGFVPGAGEEPFCCLLEDDGFVSGLEVKTDRLLDAVDDKEVFLLVRVSTVTHFAYTTADL